MNAEYYHMIVVEGCPFCDRAKALAVDSNIPHFVEDATSDKEYLTEVKKVVGHRTVPIIRKVTIAQTDVSVELIGGFTEFREHLRVEEK